MTIDLSKIRPGDEVTLAFVISAVNENGTWATRPGWHPSEAIKLNGFGDAIVSHTPKALSVGDRVKHKARSPDGEVLAVFERWVWVMHPGFPEPDVWLLCDLERVPC